MLKGLLAFFFISALQVSAQYGIRESKISSQIDPEVFLFRKDSLNRIDTTKQGINLEAYYALQYSTEMSLNRFDGKKEHFRNSIRWSEGRYYHNQTNTGPLFDILNASYKLRDENLGRKYYDLILQKTIKENWDENEKEQMDIAFSWLTPGVDPYYGPIDFDHSISCHLDTLVTIHPDAAIDTNIQRGNGHSLIKGSNNYLELKINTEKCRCRDCSYCTMIFIKLPGEKFPVSMDLDSTNCFYSSTNTWIYEPKETISFGKFYRNENGLYLVLAYRNNPSDTSYFLETYWISPEKLKEWY